MEGSQQQPAVGSKEINPVTPLSVQDFLYSLARTPTPTRFDRRRQRHFQEKPRLSRVRRVVQNASRSDGIGAGSLQHDQAPRGALSGADLPLDTEDCQRPLDNEPDSLTIEQTIQVAQLALLNPAADDNSRVQATKEIERKDTDADQLSKQLSITPIESPPLFDEQEYHDDAGDSSMFVSAHSM
jgi:hypothetical protein